MDYYLYLAKTDSQEQLPELLRKKLGKLTWVMQLDLQKITKLANADIQQVTLALETQGYYLQIPPDSPLCH